MLSGWARTLPVTMIINTRYVDETADAVTHVLGVTLDRDPPRRRNRSVRRLTLQIRHGCGLVVDRKARQFARHRVGVPDSGVGHLACAPSLGRSRRVDERGVPGASRVSLESECRWKVLCIGRQADDIQLVVSDEVVPANREAFDRT